MAINRVLTYPTKFGIGTGSYPLGEPRSVSQAGAGDGSPWGVTWIKDWDGLFQYLLTAAAIVPSGTPDNAVTSQYFQALQALFVQQSQLIENGGDILQSGNNLPSFHRDGLRAVRNSGTLVTVNPGSARNFGNTADLTLAASLQKDISVPWAQGPGGGKPFGVTLTANTWYRHFIVSRPDGVTDLCWDTSPTASNFFADPIAIAAGFSDPTLYRRFGHTRTDVGLAIREFFNYENDPTIFRWAQSSREYNAEPSDGGSRTMMDLSGGAPPDCFVVANMWGDFSVSAAFLIITEEAQDDTAPTSSNYTMRTQGSPSVVDSRGEWLVNAASELGARRSGGMTNPLEVYVDGWRDPAIIA